MDIDKLDSNIDIKKEHSEIIKRMFFKYMQLQKAYDMLNGADG